MTADDDASIEHSIDEIAQYEIPVLQIPAFHDSSTSAK
jgi:hypothetical protein